MSDKESAKPPVPRRSQSFKIIRNYSAPETGLKVMDVDIGDDPNKYRATRPINRKLRSRRSLDAMEKQASELLNFLSELECKKASNNDDDVLAFLADSQSGKSSNSSPKSTPERKFPVRRVSVKDRAKLFLKPDIKEESKESNDDVELDKNSNHISKQFQGLSLAPQLVPCKIDGDNDTSCKSNHYRNNNVAARWKFKFSF